MNEWKLVSELKPPTYRNVLFAFKEHWNQVVGFRSLRGGNDMYHETSAHDNNSEISKPYPHWWMEIPQVPHHPEVAE
jgi:hypothetical protein